MLHLLCKNYIFIVFFLGVRQQQNQRSSFIDGSAIYGFNTAKENSLREKRGGGYKWDGISLNPA